ncbi:MAG: hypothetical protein P1V21_20035 [Rhizobiaceae bacterium]|nr:hypothetical protein [Rhizobiaceae bacterium]
MEEKVIRFSHDGTHFKVGSKLVEKNRLGRVEISVGQGKSYAAGMIALVLLAAAFFEFFDPWVVSPALKTHEIYLFLVLMAAGALAWGNWKNYNVQIQYKDGTGFTEKGLRKIHAAALSNYLLQQHAVDKFEIGTALSFKGISGIAEPFAMVKTRPPLVSTETIFVAISLVAVSLGLAFLVAYGLYMQDQSVGSGGFDFAEHGPSGATFEFTFPFMLLAIIWVAKMVVNSRWDAYVAIGGNEDLEFRHAVLSRKP